ncbi:MAG: FKBP-type peptidyl-prolyl cis-trans isomerase [Chryseotalea sp. WA131a]|jgi:FKBP-type peptidyl-prolyl cis-trans isomerase|nr:MAG: FKBP-type peptidyl-prolyl cis-trans isomerase [Chryseotalea sp. WA131a]
MKNYLVASLLILTVLASCTNSKETMSGFKYTLLREGKGAKVDSGKYAVVSFYFKDGKDSIWNDTRKTGYPGVILIGGDAFIKGDAVMEVLKKLTKGDSVTFNVKAKTLFQNTFRQNIPFGIDTAQLFTFNIGVQDIIDEEGKNKLQQDLIAKENAKMLKDQQEQFAKDTVLIDDYLKSKNVSALKTASGLRYVITQEGKGENAKAGQKVQVNYCGYLLNGKYFDCSTEAAAKEHGVFSEGRKPYLPLDGQQQLIPGMEEAIRLMNKGAKITVYIPSTLAYGNQRRSADIIENSILVFDMEMLDIEKTK